MNPTLDIIIVNWNAGSQLRECLESIALSSKDGFRLDQVVVVDNASFDGSLQSLDGLPLQVRTIHNLENRGFSVACNQGAEDSTAEYLLFLNPDTRLTTESLNTPIAFLQKPENQKTGIVGIQLVDEIGTVSRSCARFPTFKNMIFVMLGLNRLFPQCFPGHFMSDWDHLNNAEVDQVMGSFFLVRSALFKLLGGFDQRFFVYYEEVDFSIRAKQKGFTSYYLTDTAAYHRGGGDVRTGESKTPFLRTPEPNSVFLETF